MKVLITLILLYLLVSGCANIQSPPGGPGDTLAPYIEYTEPTDKTINFRENSVTIGFDEYMNRAKVIESLRITPEAKMSYDWSSTKLNITFEEPLQPNTTYAINIGTDYTDYYNNPPKKAFSLIFSTGNKLDSGTISGVISAPDTKGKYVFLYKSKDGQFPNMETAQPDYYTNTGSSGEFQFVALKPGKYRLLAVDDKFQNHKYDDQIDDFGTSLSDITLTEDSLSVSGVNIHIGNKTDKIGPKIISAESRYAGIANILFDENLDINTIKKENFELSYDGNEVPIKSIGINKATSSELMIVFDKNLMGQTLKLTAHNLKDSTGNLIQDTANFTVFKVDSTFNNDEFKIISTNLNDSTKTNVSPNFNILNESSSFRIKFSKIPDVDSLKDSAYLESNGKKSKVNVISDNLLDYYFISTVPIAENTEYQLIFNTKDIIDIWGNKLTKDTTYKTKFKTEFLPKYSKLAGTIELKSDCAGNVVITARNTKDKSNYTVIAENGMWSFDKVTSGVYIFEIYCDSNRDGKYNFGSVNPFTFREKYSKSKEYTVEENWEYKDIKLKLDE